MTQAELVTAINSYLTSGNNMPMSTHRTMLAATIVAELYNAVSRGQVIATVGSEVSAAGGDTVLIVRAGALKRLPYTALQGSKYRGAHSLAGNAYPSTGGSGTGGAILAGDQWYVSVAGNLDLGTGAEPVPVKSILVALVDAPGTTPANWRVI